MKTDCPDMEILLAEFAADELEAADAERVAAHVAGCDECRAELNRELALRRALGGLPVQSGPAVHAPQAAPSRRPRFAGRRRWWSLAGGLAAAAVVAVLFLPGERGETPGTATGDDLAVLKDQIRRDARASLVLAASILERSERHTVVDVFGRQLPAAFRESLPEAAVTPEGGQG